MSDFPWNSSDIPWNFLGNSVERNVSGLCYIIYMGSALPYDDRHDNEKKLVDCEVCGKRFLIYQDKVKVCSECLADPTIKKQRNRNATPIAFLFD